MSWHPEPEDQDLCLDEGKLAKTAPQHTGQRPRSQLAPRRWPDGRFRARRRRRTRCACGELATRKLSVRLLSAATQTGMDGISRDGIGSSRNRDRLSRPAWYTLHLCEDCYAIEKQAHTLPSDDDSQEDT